MGGRRTLRLDELIVKRGFARSRSQAADLIKLGRVFVNGLPCTKPGKLVEENADISISRERFYVSRGGEKLESAWKAFEVDFSGKTVCDIGASIGGFTHFALLHGAAKVFAVDVGENQLHESLRADPRVVVVEKFNARYLTEEVLGEKVDIVLCDVSFISVKLILPAIDRVLKPEGEALVLVKPQFEVGRNVKQTESVHVKLLLDILRCAEMNHLHPAGLVECTVRGGKGQIEYFLHLERNDENKLDVETVSKIVEASWNRSQGRGKL
ncbi:MAG: TlyA family RNA methyltransferase [Pseudothermotoga sp.]|nr:TlyA family RNA methyltransferase [Pseudothermotoga sp.]HBT38868.1 TlyA family rRNA (cytidine-2'-O)-methyltransferase [Pseudothermotoga sp.]HCO97882.1 TlyA family rRNA (cytidine-2'-O)-methyltransferase [Pseudothermotoga sp.]